MRRKMVALLAGAMMMMATSAMAIPISGNISFVGTLNLTGPSPTVASNATGVDFVSSIVLGGKSGDYAAVADFTPVTFTDFTFSPFTPIVDDLWKFTVGSTVYSFDLLSVSSYNVPSNVLSLNGSGLMQITGFEDTVGSWSLTTQDGQSGTLTFSSASAVPEPGTMMLLGTGMLGLAVFGKRRMNKQA